MRKLELVYEGKAKRLYATDNPDVLIMEYKDDLTAFNKKKVGSFADKGRINKEISDLLFLYLHKKGIANHIMAQISDTETAVKKVSIIPIEFVVRNRAEGSIVKRLGLAVGTVFKEPIIEMYFKRDELDDPMISESHAKVIFGVTEEELLKAKAMCLAINEQLSDIFKKAGFILFDFKIELGRFNGEIILSDEISPDSCRLREEVTGEIFDKDRFRRDLGNIDSAYREVLKRLKGVIND